MRSVADAEFVRRQNRGLVLSALRRRGPMSRTQLAAATGLSPASITAIGGELIAQAIIVDEGAVMPATRGRPAVQVGFNRSAGYAVIVELDVNQARFSLVDYAGTLVDRIESAVTPTLFADVEPAQFLIDAVTRLQSRNPEVARRLRRVAISVQGILDRSGDGLIWSPIAHLNGASLVEPVRAAFDTATTLHKRGRLLAEGARLLYPELAEVSLAAVFIGSTVAMGLSMSGSAAGPDAGATEFGHMNHVPDGARCRCGMRGCVEAYAADYGVLRTAYGVPDKAPPAATVPAAAYQELVQRAKSGQRNALHAFHTAGRAIGAGIGRLMSVASPAHVVITGPGAGTYDLMRGGIAAALAETLVCRVNGPPDITLHGDEREPIFQGMMMETLSGIDQDDFAPPASTRAVV